jgi:hypothetical protein
MKKLCILTSLFFAMLLTFSCGNNAQNEDKNDSTTVEKSQTGTNALSEEDALTLTAKFIDGNAFEGDGVFVFQKEDGSKIIFYRNYFNDEEPELKYDLIGNDAPEANRELIGKTFVIKYKVNPEGFMSEETGKAEPCNQILSLEIK